jgi:LmbE family N-acetylglucosaminyl deacetylase
MKCIDSFDKIFSNKSKVLVVMGHPDDNEIICGGLVARLIDQGKKVRLISLTNGGKGFQNRTDVNETQFSQIRLEEQKKAGLKLGVPAGEIINFNIPDGEVEATVENIGKVVYHIRQFKPDIVITQNPEEIINTFSEDVHWINHRDHRRTAEIVFDACYPYSRDRGFFPQHFKDGLEPHSLGEILISDSYTHPDAVYFDVTNYLDKRKDALNQHKNALSPEEVDGMMEEIKKDNGSFETLRHIIFD